MLIFRGMKPQKQGTLQFIGSSSRGWIVCIAFAGSNVLNRVGVTVAVSVEVGGLTVMEGVGISVSVIVDVSVKVGTIVALARGAS